MENPEYRQKQAARGRARKQYSHMNKDSRRTQVQKGRENRKHARANLTLSYVRSVLTSAKARALEKDLDYTLKENDVVELHRRLQVGFCEATSLPWDLSVKIWSPSIDRIDNTGGYTMDNVRWVVWIYNWAKGTSSDSDVYRLANAIVSKNTPPRENQSATTDQASS